MEESALKTLLDNLDISRSSLHAWLHFWTFLVVVGVALEVIFVVWEYREQLHDWQHGIVHPPEKPNILLFVLGLLGAGLVATGVAGELYVDVQAGKVETEIRKANDRRVSLLSEEAGDAAKSAKTAHDEASAVKGIADAARKDAEDALAKAQIAQRELARAESDASKAQSEASKVRQEVDSTQKRIERVSAHLELIEKYEEPRHLTEEQKERLKSLLSDEPASIMFGWCMSGSDDCLDFVNDIGDPFNKAGWKTTFSASTQYKRGVYLGFAKGSDERLAGHWVPKLRDALCTVGLSSEQTWFDPNEKSLSAIGFEKNVLYLIVGQKPSIKTLAMKNNCRQ